MKSRVAPVAYAPISMPSSTWYGTLSIMDMKYKLEVMEYLQNMARKDMTILVAEHDISLMARYCDICIIMKKGSIVTIGDPKKVITEDLIREVYEVDARVGFDVDGEIYVLPKKYIK